MFSAQPTSSYLEPWRSWLTIRGTHNVFAAGLIFKHSVNPTSFLEICLHLISFYRDASATRIDIYTGTVCLSGL